MKKILLLTILIFFISSLHLNNLYSDLSDFEQGFKKEESEKRKSSGGSSSGSFSSSSEDGCSEAMGEFAFYILVAWAQFNFSLRYSSYPYQLPDSNNFIFHYFKGEKKHNTDPYDADAKIDPAVPVKKQNAEETIEDINELQNLNRGTRFSAVLCRTFISRKYFLKA
ncbi:MAG: hypothetical protein JW864_08495 [Spirochaetes bacterium]|nr:hypothetical protein [Spirochaetota bacterium]